MDELFHVRVDVSIEAPYGSGQGNLRISESLEVPSGTFLELAGRPRWSEAQLSPILGEFHKVVEGLRAAKP